MPYDTFSTLFGDDQGDEGNELESKYEADVFEGGNNDDSPTVGLGVANNDDSPTVDNKTDEE